MLPADKLATSARVIAAVIAAGCLAVLITAYLLEASPRGVGSHTKLGLAPCGWLAMFGKPCITCGYTTTFALTAKGEFGPALRNQPVAVLACIATSVAVWLAGYAAMTGQRIDRIAAIFVKPVVLWSFGGLLLAGWWYKVATFGP
jgi:hypothetical protein